MTKGLVRANNFSDLADKDEAVVNLGLSAADYAALKGLYTTAGIDFAVIGEIGNSQGNYQAQLDGIGTTLSGVVLSGYVNRSGDTILGTWTHSGIINISSGLPSGYPASTDSLFSLSIESGEAVIVASGLIASGLSYNGVRQSSSTVQRAFPPSGFSPLHLIPLQVGGQSFFAEAGESPSFHIAPARTGHALDLVTGNLLGSYNSASPAWAVGPDGVLFQPAANAPVIEYDPATLQCLGARIWGAVTNQIRNNTMVGAAAGTPGTVPTNYIIPATSNGLSRQIVGTGQSGNIDYIDVRYFGTTTAGGSTVIQPEGPTVVVATTGQTWTASSYVLMVAGSTTGITSLRQRVVGRTSGGSLLEFTDATISTATSLVTARFSASMAFANASTARVTSDILLNYNSGAAIDITLRIGLPQLEQSAVMGPIVKTTGTTASSTADAWSITGADFTRIWNQSAVTMYAEAVRDVVPAGEFPVLLDARTINGLEIAQISYLLEPIAGMFARNSGGIQAEQYPTVGGRTRRVAAAFAQDNFAVSANGQSALVDNSGTMPTPDRMSVGSVGGGQFLNGYIRGAAIFRSRRPNANLQAMTL